MGSERLTDEELAKLLADNTVNGEPRPNRAYATSSVLVMLVAELRERRAADLSDEERGVLEWADEWIKLNEPRSKTNRKKQALFVALLDRLLQRKDGGV